MTKHPAAPIAEAKQCVEVLTVEEVATALALGEAILLDLRELEERAQHGSLAFWDEFTSAYYRAQPFPNGRVVLYCAAGGRSALAVATLQQMSYANVAHLDGGFTAWKAASQPVVDTALA
jgi:rhodanese-related sulfurtransferase